MQPAEQHDLEIAYGIGTVRKTFGAVFSSQRATSYNAHAR